MKITGTVTDKQTGEPLFMANVAVVGSTVGTTTDFDGNYSLEIDQPAKIGYSYVGYAMHTFTPSQSCTHNVALVPGVDLPEVTITAPGQTWWEKNRTKVIAAAVAVAVVAIIATTIVLTLKKSRK